MSRSELPLESVSEQLRKRRAQFGVVFVGRRKTGRDIAVLRETLGKSAFLDAVAKANRLSPRTRNFWSQILEMDGGCLMHENVLPRHSLELLTQLEQDMRLLNGWREHSNGVYSTVVDWSPPELLIARC